MPDGLCHLPKRTIIEFWNGVGFFGQLLKQTNFSWFNIARFGVKWLEFLYCQFIEHLGIIAEQVCLIGHDCWKAALSRALGICQAGLVDRLHTFSSGTDNPRLPTLFW